MPRETLHDNYKREPSMLRLLRPILPVLLFVAGTWAAPIT